MRKICFHVVIRIVMHTIDIWRLGVIGLDSNYIRTLIEKLFNTSLMIYMLGWAEYLCYLGTNITPRGA